MFLPTFLDQSVEHLLAWHVNLSHTNVNLLNTKMLYRKSVRQIYISNVKLFDRLTLILFDRFSGKIFQQIYMCDRFANWPNWACKSVDAVLHYCFCHCYFCYSCFYFRNCFCCQLATKNLILQWCTCDPTLCAPAPSPHLMKCELGWITIRGLSR